MTFTCGLNVFVSMCVCVWYCSPVEQQTKTRSLKQLCPWWWIGVAATTHDSTNINLPPPTGQWHALASLLGSGCRADWGQKVALDSLAQSGPPNYQNKIDFCDQSCIFSIITPVFSVTWSFKNHSNMLICCSRNIYYYQCWKLLCCFIFLWKMWYHSVLGKIKKYKWIFFFNNVALNQIL